MLALLHCAQNTSCQPSLFRKRRSKNEGRVVNLTSYDSDISWTGDSASMSEFVFNSILTSSPESGLKTSETPSEALTSDPKTLWEQAWDKEYGTEREWIEEKKKSLKLRMKPQRKVRLMKPSMKKIRKTRFPLNGKKTSKSSKKASAF